MLRLKGILPQDVVIEGLSMEASVCLLLLEWSVFATPLLMYISMQSHFNAISVRDMQEFGLIE